MKLMKHNILVTIVLVGFFLVAQFLGMIIVDRYNTVGTRLPYNIERPQFEKSTSYINIAIMVLIATVIALLIMRFKAVNFFRLWFFIGIAFLLTVSFAAFLRQSVALLLALVFSGWRIAKNNVYIQNFTELFVYGGLATLFANSLNVFSASILLIIISIYDMIAVWKTKHMIDLAKFQTKSKVFAGFLIPYKKGTAILGGGDVAFTLLFAVSAVSLGKLVYIIPVFSAASLFLLFYYAKKKKFYPAMPFLSLGCFAGYFVAKVLELFLFN